MGGGGSALRVCAEHRGGINWLSLSPDGQRLLTGSEDGTARLWSAADGQCCALLQGTRSRGPPSRRPPRTPARSRRPSARAGRVLRGAGPARGAACDRGQRAKGRPLRGRRSLVSPLREIISTTKVLTNKKKSHLRRCALPGPTPWRVTSDQTHLSGQSGRGPGLVRCGSAKHDSAQSSRYCYPTGAGRETEARG